MKIWILLLSLLFLKCNSDLKKDFKISLHETSRKFTPQDTLRLDIVNQKNHPIDSIVYQLGKKKISPNESLIKHPLGIHLLTATVYSSGKKNEYQQQISILSNAHPKLYS